MDRAIEASTHIRATVATARDILHENPAVVLGDDGPWTRRQATRPIHATIAADLGGGTLIEQAVDVDLGRVPAGTGDVGVELSWTPRGREHLLPSFAGTLEVSAATGGSRLTIRGTYHVPLGPIGRFGDTLVGRRLARQSLTEFVARLASHIDAEADRRHHHTVTAVQPTPYNVDLREHARSAHLTG